MPQGRAIDHDTTTTGTGIGTATGTGVTGTETGKGTGTEIDTATIEDGNTEMIDGTTGATTDGMNEEMIDVGPVPKNVAPRNLLPLHEPNLYQNPLQHQHLRRKTKQ